MPHAERRWNFSAAILVLLARGASGILHEHLSFNPPFLDVDHFGKRTVGYAWDLSGETKALKNFVRLTPDQQASAARNRCKHSSVVGRGRELVCREEAERALEGWQNTVPPCPEI